MCESPNQAFLCSHPKYEYGNFMILTRQYRELAQLQKEYLFFPSERNWHFIRRFENIQKVFLPCGKCIQCLNSRSKSWEVRSSLELLNYKDACCLTLTYDDSHLPLFGKLKYKDVQDFLKRLRKDIKKPIKYMCSGEYGGTKTRPHYHIIIFGYKPEDMRLYKRTKKGTLLYKSDYLTDKWSKGFVDVGKVNHQTCRYVSQYCCKKLLNETVKMPPRYRRIYEWKRKKSREFLHCSVKFGFDWFKRNYRSVINSSKIVLGRFTYAIPRYFIKKLEEINKRLYDSYKMKTHEFWINFKNTDEDQRNARARSDRLLSKLNLFHSQNVGLLAS